MLARKERLFGLGDMLWLDLSGVCGDARVGAEVTNPGGNLRAILFTDIVQSTSLMQRIGDERARVAFQAHHDFMHSIIATSAGEFVEWTGDGVMAAFNSASDALHCALAIQQSTRRDVVGRNFEVRIGLNAGEVLRGATGRGYFGTPVVVARRLCDYAEAGQILCSTTVVGLVPGPRMFSFRELGSLHLKGVEDAVPAVEVSWKSSAPRLDLSMLETLVQALPDIVIATDELRCIVLFSDGAERNLGYSRAEILGQHIAKLYSSPEDARRVMTAIPRARPQEAASVAGVRTVLVTKAGDRLPVTLSTSMLLDSDGSLRGTIGYATCTRD